MSLVLTIKSLFPELRDIKPFKSSSAGYSLKYKAINKDDEAVIIKLSFEPKSIQYNNQIVECQIYQHVIVKLRQHTPHLPKPYGIKNFKTEHISDREKYRIKRWGVEDHMHMNAGQILLIKNVGPYTLWSIWDEEADNPHITFQVLYTIACFERVGLKHNDLHLNNIFVQITDEEHELRYEIGEEIVSFKTTRFIKIIDYDRSSIYHSDVERNGSLDEFQKGDDTINQYNGVNNGHDAFKFLSSYKTYSLPNHNQLKTWLNFECPGIFEVDYPKDLISPDINPRNFIPNTISLLKSLSENFTEHFSISQKTPYLTFWSLPEDTSVKPITDTTKFPVCKVTKSRGEDGFLYMYKELRSLGYNWRLHHCKLFEEVKDYLKIIKPDEKESEIYNACIHITNPLRNEYYTELETLILEKFQPILTIPQKYFPYSNKQY